MLHQYLSRICHVCLVLLLTCTVSLAASNSPSAGELMERGRAAARQGAWEDALLAWKAAADRYDGSGETKNHIHALTQAAFAARTLGHVNQAFLQEELALHLARTLQDPHWLAITLSELGKTYLANHQYEVAADYIAQASEIAQTQPFGPLSAALQNDLGIVLALQGRLEEALEAFHRSAIRAKQEGLIPLFIRARVNVARMAIQLAQFEVVTPALDEAAGRLPESGTSYEKADALVNLALGYRDLALAHPSSRASALKRSAALLQEAAESTQQPGDARLASYAYGHLGHLYELERRYAEALHLTRRAVFTAQSARAPESLYRWQWQRGRLLNRLGHLDDALSAYQEAAMTLHPIRSEVTFALQATPDQNQPSTRTLYFELADLLLRRAALMPDTREAEPHLRAARDVIEAFKAAELRDYFRDDCVDQMQARLTKLDTLSPSTAIIYPIVFGDRTELLVSLPDGLARHSVPVTATTLTDEVRRFRHKLEKRTTREYLPHAQQLYDWLIRPLAPDLRRHNVDRKSVV